MLIAKTNFLNHSFTGGCNLPLLGAGAIGLFGVDSFI
jgi:hypothetical protein